jgi:hypothetical protein
MTRKLALFALLFVAFRLSAQLSPGIRWGVSAGSPDYLEYATGIDLDDAGNVYLCGTYRTGAQFGDSVIAAVGISGDFFAASYSRTGDFRWVFHVGGSLPDEAMDICAKVPGNVFVTGYAKGAALPPGSTALHAKDFYIARLDTAGNLIWQRAFNGDDSGEGFAVVADGAANCYVAGMFKEEMYLLSGDTLFSNGMADMFVAKFNPAGGLDWIRNFGGSTGDDYAYGIGLDATGAVYVGGYFTDNLVSGPVNLDGWAGKDACILKLTPSGDPIWGVALNGKGADQLLGLDVTADGHVYACGTLSDTLLFAGDTLTTTGGTDSWAARFDSTGALVWVNTLTGAGTQSIQDISVNEREQVFMTGYFSNAVSYLGSTLVSVGFDDSFVLKTDSDGSVMHAKAYGFDMGAEYSQGIQGDANGNFAFAGLYGPTLALDTVTLSSNADSEDIFAALWCDTLTLTLADVSGPPHCLGDNFTVEVEATGCYDPNNVFHVELSDATGSFASPDTVGSLAGCLGGSINCTIPATATGGSGYVVRVTSSLPALTTAPSAPPFPITTSLSNPVVIVGDTIICAGDTVSLDAGAGYVSYVWSTGDFTQVIEATLPGLYTVEVQDTNGCTTQGQHLLSLCVSVEEAALLSDLEIYPNPSQGSFSVKLGDESIDHIEMWDVQGRRIEIEVTEKGADFLSVRMVRPASGVYVVKVGQRMKRVVCVE